MLSFNHYNSSSGQFALSSTANSLNTLPSYESSLEDNLDLVKVLGKLAIDGFRQLNRFFTWHSGEKASLEETQNYGSKMWKIVENEMFKLEKLDRHLTIKRSNPSETEAEVRRLGDLQGHVIDLLFEGMGLEDQISDLKSSSSLPSKPYLLKLGKEIDQFVKKIYSDPIGDQFSMMAQANQQAKGLKKVI